MKAYSWYMEEKFCPQPAFELVRTVKKIELFECKISLIWGIVELKYNIHKKTACDELEHTADSYSTGFVLSLFINGRIFVGQCYHNSFLFYFIRRKPIVFHQTILQVKKIQLAASTLNCSKSMS